MDAAAFEAHHRQIFAQLWQKQASMMGLCQRDRAEPVCAAMDEINALWNSVDVQFFEHLEHLRTQDEPSALFRQWQPLFSPYKINKELYISTGWHVADLIARHTRDGYTVAQLQDANSLNAMIDMMNYNASFYCNRLKQCKRAQPDAYDQDCQAMTTRRRV
jgi:hypothetical protein